MTQIPFKPESQEKATVASNAVVPPQTETSKRVGQLPLMGEQSSTKRPAKSLSRQLLQTVLPLALIPLTIESLISYFITESRTQAEFVNRLEGYTLVVNETISENIDDEFIVTNIIASNPQLLGMIRSGARKVDAENLSLSKRTVNDIEARYGKTKLLESNQTMNNYLAQAAKAQGFSEIIVTEKNGLNVAFNALSSDFVQVDEDWWIGAKEQTRWISNPTYDESAGGRFGINLSQAIQDPKTGNFLGVFKAFITTSEFDEARTLLAKAGIQGSQEVQLLDVSLGSVLLSYSEAGRKEPENSLQRLNVVGGSSVADIAGRVLKTSRVKQPDIAALQRELQSAYPVQNLKISKVAKTDRQSSNQKETTSQQLLASFTYGGKQYAMSVLPILDWVAIASMDTAEIQAAGRGMLGVFGLTVLVLGGAAAAITLGLSRRLASPLNDLSLKAQQVSAGNLDVTAEPRGSSEAQTLAETFNDLVFRVKGFLREQALNTRRATLAAEITGAQVENVEGLLPVFDRLVQEARNILGSDRTVIYRFNSDWSGTIVAESVPSHLPSAQKQNLNDPCIPEATREKYRMEGILLEQDVASAQFHPEHLELLSNLKVKSILGVPIVSQGNLYGLLITHHCTTLHRWQSSEVDFMKQLGLQLGLVIERVNLLEQTRNLAEEQRQITEGLQRNALQLLMDVDPVSQGNLTVRAKVTEDEIGTVADSYNATIASLRKIVLQVQDAARQVANTTDANEGSVRTLSASAAQQAEDILAALEQVQAMANSVRLVATNAEKAEIAVQEAAQTVQEGDEAMNRTVDGILSIRETVAETAKKVKRLGESSQKISNVVNLISGFAAQTNMLALNASIEASRAGEDGKGFAVVAEEVRGLARQSAEATTEIEKLVANIQAETNEVIKAMESGTEQVVTGTKLVDDTRQSLNKITATSRLISELVESIAQATVVQSQASETVTTAMTTVAEIANQNSTAANQVSDSFLQLRSVAQALQEEVGRFKVE